MYEEKFWILININEFIYSISQLLIIICFIYFFISFKSFIYLKKEFSIIIIIKTFYIILIPLIDKIIFNQIIYSHHILSIFIFLNSLFIKFLNEKDKISLIYIIVILLNNIVYILSFINLSNKIFYKYF